MTLESERAHSCQPTVRVGRSRAHVLDSPLILDVDNVAVHLHSSLLVVDFVVQVLAVVGSAFGDLVHTVGHENCPIRSHILLHLIVDKRLEVLDLLARRFTVALDLNAVDLHVGATARLKSLANSQLTGV